MIKYVVYGLTTKRDPIVHLTDEYRDVYKTTFCYETYANASTRRGLVPTCLLCVARLMNVYADNVSGFDVVFR